MLHGTSKSRVFRRRQNAKYTQSPHRRSIVTERENSPKKMSWEPPKNDLGRQPPRRSPFFDCCLARQTPRAKEHAKLEVLATCTRPLNSQILRYTLLKHILSRYTVVAGASIDCRMRNWSGKVPTSPLPHDFLPSSSLLPSSQSCVHHTYHLHNQPLKTGKRPSSSRAWRHLQT